jgi:hypothetical protein
VLVQAEACKDARKLSRRASSKQSEDDGGGRGAKRDEVKETSLVSREHRGQEESHRDAQDGPASLNRANEGVAKLTSRAKDGKRRKSISPGRGRRREIGMTTIY